jgi:pyruvate dehydrogenase E2 component (dihydrolipoamide acetyltransferase)
MGVFTMPSLGADMEAGTLVEWLKQPGDHVNRGDIIAVVETEKGAIEVEIFEEGKLGRLLVQPGTKVPVGTPLAIVGDEAEAETEGEAGAEVPAQPPPGSPAVAAPGAPAAAWPASAAGPIASPAARHLADQRGVNLAGLTGSGPSGAITLADVEAAAAKPAPAAAGASPGLGAMRRAIAAAMERSKREIPHYYLSHTLDAGAAKNAVEVINAARPPEERILLSALLLKAVALAVREFPEFNGFYGPEGRQESSAIHVGMAIALRGGGLAAPAIHDTDSLPVPELMVKMRDLVGRVRRGGFRSSEISDPTVTVSSLGDRGVESLLPIIYPPQVAILGFGSVEDRPWAVQSQVVTRPLLTVTLAADHRVSDGHRGALLLRRVDQLLQTPEKL